MNFTISGRAKLKAGKVPMGEEGNEDEDEQEQFHEPPSDLSAPSSPSSSLYIQEAHQPSGETHLGKLLAELKPILRSDGPYVYVTLSDNPLQGIEVFATVREDEGLTYVIKKHDADKLGLSYVFVSQWITLQVFSSLSAVGLTAAVASSLAKEGISCNVLAGFHHDHILVPISRADDAIRALHSLVFSALCDRGTQLAIDGEYGDARQVLASALSLATTKDCGSTPSDISIVSEMLAQLFLELEMVWEAVTLSEKAVSLRPDWATAWITLARSRRECGEILEAQTAFRRAQELNPSEEEAHIVREELAEVDLYVARRKQHELEDLFRLEQARNGGGGSAIDEEIEVLTCKMNLKRRWAVGTQHSEV